MVQKTSENTHYLVRLLLPATADLDFGKAAQKLIDKIESGKGTWVQSQSASWSNDLFASGCMEELTVHPVIAQVTDPCPSWSKSVQWSRHSSEHGILIDAHASCCFDFLNSAEWARSNSTEQKLTTILSYERFQMFKSWLERSSWTGKSSKSASRILNTLCDDAKCCELWGFFFPALSETLGATLYLDCDLRKS